MYIYSVGDLTGPTKNVARSLRQRMTPTERFVWKKLRKRQIGFYFRRQHIIGGFVVDFYCHRAKLCIELDGLSHEVFHSREDGNRDAALAHMGIRTLRFRNEQIALDWASCAQKIFAICIERSSQSGLSDEVEDAE